MKYSPAGKARFNVLLLLIMAIIALAWIVIRRAVFSESGFRHIVLISIDTCRADHLSCYGHSLQTTPNIDRIAEKSTRFANVYSPLPLTLPAHSSMLTGTIPPYHGVHDNLEYRLSRDNDTLAEILSRNGYTTAAIVSTSVLEAQYGINQGFDTFNDRIERKSITDTKERRAEKTTQLAIDWLEKHRKEKSFLFLHYYDPHLPYDAPSPFSRKFKDDPYSGEIAYTDYYIGKVVEKLKKLGIYNSTLLIIAGDHGEMLNEHGEIDHGYFIYQSAVRVPLIIKLPGPDNSRVIDQPVGIIDIVPTICSLLDIELPTSLQGQDLSGYISQDGYSLPDRYLFCESLYATKYSGNSMLAVVGSQWKYIQTTRPELYDIIQDPAEKNNLFEQEPARARILQDKLKQILEASVRKTSSDSKAVITAQDRKSLESLGYVSGSVDEDFQFDQTKEDPKDLIAFHLMYKEVINFTAKKKFRQAKKVCEKMLLQRPQSYNAHSYMGVIAMEGKNFQQAAGHFKKALDVKPDDFDTLEKLGSMLARLGKHSEAIKYFRRAQKVRPNNSGMYNNLALSLYYQIKNDMDKGVYNLTLANQSRGMWGRTVTYLRKAIELNKYFDDAYLTLGVVLKEQGKLIEAIETSQNVLAVNPDFSSARFNLDLDLKQKKQLENSIAGKTNALAKNPDNSVLHRNLGDIYFQLGNMKKALYHNQKALELDPQSPTIMNNLAYFLATQSKKEFRDEKKAIQLALQLCQQTNFNDPSFLDTLAMANAADGQFTQAIETAQKAIKAAQLKKLQLFADEIKSRLELYKSNKAYFE